MYKDPNGFNPHEISDREKEEASNAYLMTLMVGFVGLPLPIINLIASVAYFLMNKSKSKFVRFHIFQAMVSQIFIVIMNSIALSWTLNIVFGSLVVSNYYIGYIVAAVIFNLLDIIANIIAAIQVRKGRLYSFLFFGVWAKMLYYKDFEKDLGY
jgi:uncharacterized Tic20 family protein